MRLPDEVPKSVVFLGNKGQSKQTGIVEDKLIGTAFFVALQVNNKSNLILLVTAAHIARKLETGQFFIRANTKSGSAEDFWLDEGSSPWLYHPSDASVDAAMLLWTPPEHVDYLCIPEGMTLNDERLVSTKIGIGDETYVAGLFRFHTGEKRNEPIIRSGHIAMMPKERIPVPEWHATGLDGYLIETRAIGGLSGAPVFAQRSIEVQATENSGRIPVAAGAIFWLGLIHGHWKASLKTVDGVDPDTNDPEKKINAGIAIVIPSKKIIELINQDAIRDACAKAAGASEDEMAAVIDNRTEKPTIGQRITLSVATSAGSFLFPRPAGHKPRDT